MANLTAKQQRFVTAKSSGLSNRDAGLLAGYSRATVDQAVSRLMANPEIKAALRKARKQQSKSSPGAEDAQDSDENKSGLRESYDSPLDFMRHCMNNPRLPTGVRFEAAKQMLPYEHARVGEKGKKETTKDRAHDVGKGRFKSKAPPPRASGVVVPMHRG